MMTRTCQWVLGAALSAALSVGCQGTCAPHAQTGWRFEVLKPALMVSGPNATAVTSSQSSGLVGIDHNTALTGMPGPVESQAVLSGRYAQRVRTNVSEAAALGCSLQEVCERLERIERRMTAPAVPLAMPSASQQLPPLRPRAGEPCP